MMSNQNIGQFFEWQKNIRFEFVCDVCVVDMICKRNRNVMNNDFMQYNAATGCNWFQKKKKYVIDRNMY